ncbi:hypothetical protein [Streptomyces sp. NL15-2K]|uniref:hypothetical protein n=1 Tax=Streptomyces sp. NL15-2K TaxID=376149 RepID=UPI000FF96E43|nr:MULTISPECIES: hypothetical protein [Actinomycetes]WKX10122.1 hypothetical protein Q4V64_22530 [Kutzneria buriramensis]GCB48387.1 tetR family transcriptional regulator [Streptomyces sp. NL15-2K]
MGDDPWVALLDTVDLLAAPATEPLVPALVMEAMIQAYRDPELEALLSREQDEERATKPSFSPAAQLRTLRLILQRLLRPGTPAG